MGEPSPKNHRKELGKLGESMAARWLADKGYRILSQNWREAPWEVDLIVAAENEVVFVEVKTRRVTQFGHPEESIDERKMEYLLNAADAWCEASNYDGPIRFDVISIFIDEQNRSTIRHWEDAFGGDL